MKKYIFGAVLSIGILASPAFTQAQAQAQAQTACVPTVKYSTGLNNCQVSSILGLLQAFNADSNAITTVQGVLTGNTTTTQSSSPIIDAVKNTLANKLGISVSAISLVSINKTQWSNGCLGVDPGPNAACTQSLVVGYEVILLANSQQYVYHTNADASQIVEAPSTTTTQSSITVLNPTAGMTFTQGQPMTISWLAIGNPANYTVSYRSASGSGGSEYTAAQAHCDAASKCYISWTPTFSSPSITINIYDTVSGWSGGSGSFAIVPSTTTTSALIASPTFGQAPLTVSFTHGQISTDNFLDYGDGSPLDTSGGKGGWANHTYMQPGTYYAILYACTLHVSAKNCDQSKIIGKATITVTGTGTVPSVTINTGGPNMLPITYTNLRTGTYARVIGVNQPWTYLPITFSNVYAANGGFDYTNNGIASITLSGSGQSQIALPSTFTAGSYVLELSDSSNGSLIYLRSSPFQIAPVPSTSAPTITLTSPSGGDTWVANNTYRVAWKPSSNIATVRLADYPANTPMTSMYGYFAQGISASQGYYNFTTGPSPVTGTHILVIEGLDGNNNLLTSDRTTYTMASSTSAPMVTILSPNGGEQWQQGQTYQVLWQRMNFNDEVAINLIDYTPGSRYEMQYGITNGMNMRTVPGQTSFPWTIPSSIPAGDYYKAVVGMGSVNSFSSNYFTVTSAPATTPAPTGTISVSPTSCTIANGTNGCYVSLAWNTANVTNPSVFAYIGPANSGSTNPISSQPSASGYSYRITNGDTTFYLKDASTNTALSPSIKVTASCVAGSAFDATGNCNTVATTTPAPSVSTCTVSDIYAVQVPGFVYYNLYMKVNNLPSSGDIMPVANVAITGADSWNSLVFNRDGAYNASGQTVLKATQTVSDAGVSYIIARKNAIRPIKNGTTVTSCSSISGLVLGTSTNQMASALSAFENATGAGTISFSYAWNRDLQIGSSYSADVSALQAALAHEGVYTGEITGGFYDQTYWAVQDFQQKYGINRTGYVGQITRAKLNELYSE